MRLFIVCWFTATVVTAFHFGINVCPDGIKQSSMKGGINLMSSGNPPCDTWFPEWHCLNGLGTGINCYNEIGGNGCEGDCSGYTCSGESQIGRASYVNIGQGFVSIGFEVGSANCGFKVVPFPQYSCFKADGVRCTCVVAETNDPCEAEEEIPSEDDCDAQPVA